MNRMNYKVREEAPRQDTAGIQSCSFVCSKDKLQCGTITALINDQLLDNSGMPVGQLGFYESIDEQEVANQLIGAAAHWLHSHGVNEVWGPMNGASQYDHRFKIAGFDHASLPMEPNNPPYYPRQFERVGFKILHQWTTWEVVEKDKLFAKYGDFTKNRKANSAYRIVEPDLSDVDQLASRMLPLINNSWKSHIGFTPMTFESFRNIVETLVAILQPGLLKIVQQREGETYIDVAYAAMIDQVPNKLLFYSFAISNLARSTSSVFKILLGACVGTAGEYKERQFIWPLATEQLSWHRHYSKPIRRYALYRADINQLTQYGVNTCQ